MNQCFLNSAPDSLSRGQEDFQSDSHEDETAQNDGLVRKLHAECLAQDEACDADEEGGDADDEASKERVGCIVFCNRKADGKGVDGGRNPLQEERLHMDLRMDGFFFARQSVLDHETADGAEKDEGNPRNERPEKLEHTDKHIDTNPADKWHRELEKSKDTGDQRHLPLFHVRFLQAVCQRNGKGVHGKACTKKKIAQKKPKAQNDPSIQYEQKRPTRTKTVRVSLAILNTARYHDQYVDCFAQGLLLPHTLSFILSLWPFPVKAVFIDITYF